MSEINVNKIMEEIRKEAAEAKTKGEPLQFADVSHADDEFDIPDRYSGNLMNAELVNLNNFWNTSPDKEVKSSNAIKKKIKILVRKIVMLTMKIPIEKQVAFNYSVVNGLNLMKCAVDENNRLKEEVEELKARLDKMENKA